MKRPNVLQIFLRTLAALAPAVVLSMAQAAESVDIVRIDSSDDFARADRYVNRSQAESVEVVIAAGDYEISDSFRILRSRVSVVGEGTVTIRLADGSDCPVIAIGSQVSYIEPKHHIDTVSIRSIGVDGNRSAQSSEYDRRRDWIRNNGIDVRGVSGLVVEDVVARNCRSGGLVISWGCSDVLVYRSRFEGNHFDGLAYYDSERVFTVDCVSAGNQCAGLSLDNRLVDCVFARCRIADNGDVGVFARNARGLYFVDCDVEGSRQWAFFLAHDDDGRGVFDSAIVNCAIKGNNGGVRMASTSAKESDRNALSGNRFGLNGRDGRGDIDSCGAPLETIDTFDLSPRIQGMDPDTLTAALGIDQSILSIL